MIMRFGKLRRFRGRMLVAVAAFAALAVISISSTAWAVSEFYCNSCTLGSVPKVSSTAVWTANHSSTFQSKSQQIYYYPGVTSLSGTNVFGLDYYVNEGSQTARCHLLQSGTVTANCYAYRP